MKRSSIVGCLIVVGFLACGKAPKVCDPDALLTKAQLCPDRDSLGFAQEFGSGTFIGTKPIEALAMRNGGVNDLVLNAVTISGDSAFKYIASWDDNPSDATIPGTTVKGNKSVFIQVEFSPTEAKGYSGSIAIASNAENSPNKIFTVTGCGVPTDGGTSPCYRDGGTTP